MVRHPLRSSGQQGFSLIELLIVIGIIGILSVLALPRLTGFQARARQAEVRATLGHIYSLEQAFFNDNDRFGFVGDANPPTVGLGADPADRTACLTAATNEIGLVLDGSCEQTRYNYRVSAPGATFTATGVTGTDGDNKVWPNCATADAWTMVETKTMTNTSPVLNAGC